MFFAGLSSDIFDQVSAQPAVDASEWQTYTDLTSYLAGQAISNTDIGVPWSPATTAAGALQQTWTPATPAAFTSFRTDFNDPNPATPWRGQVNVTVTGPGGTRTAYAVRTGTDTRQPVLQLRARAAARRRQRQQHRHQRHHHPHPGDRQPLAERHADGRRHRRPADDRQRQLRRHLHRHRA